MLRKSCLASIKEIEKANLQYVFTHPLCHGQNVTQGQYFKRSTAGSNLYQIYRPQQWFKRQRPLPVSGRKVVLFEWLSILIKNLINKTIAKLLFKQ